MFSDFANMVRLTKSNQVVAGLVAEVWENLCRTFRNTAGLILVSKCISYGTVGMLTCLGECSQSIHSGATNSEGLYRSMSDV